MSDKLVLQSWDFSTMEELKVAFDEALEVVHLTRLDFGDAGTVYTEQERMTLVRDTLSDGSHVLNLHFFGAR